jgi:hypothetical protein
MDWVTVRLCWAHRTLPLVGYTAYHTQSRAETDLWIKDLSNERSDTIYWFETQDGQAYDRRR